MRLERARVCVQGDIVTLNRCVDTNWYEGEIDGRRGLFPVSYVEHLVDGDLSPETSPLPLSTAIIKIVFKGRGQNILFGAIAPRHGERCGSASL